MKADAMQKRGKGKGVETPKAILAAPPVEPSEPEPLQRPIPTPTRNPDRCVSSDAQPGPQQLWETEFPDTLVDDKPGADIATAPAGGTLHQHGPTTNDEGQGTTSSTCNQEDCDDDDDDESVGAETRLLIVVQGP